MPFFELLKLKNIFIFEWRSLLPIISPTGWTDTDAPWLTMKLWPDKTHHELKRTQGENASNPPNFHHSIVAQYTVKYCLFTPIILWLTGRHCWLLPPQISRISVEMGSCELLARAAVLLISASLVRIRGMSHCCPPKSIYS
jgi:hypothetical protein